MPRFDFPVSLDVEGKRVVIVGCGRETTFKVEELLRAGAKVQIVASEVSDEIAKRAEEGAIGWAARGFHPNDFEGAFLVFVMGDEVEEAHEVWAERRRMGFLLCVHDRPDFCDFAGTAIAREGDLQIAMTTGGRAPALLRRLREELERELPATRLGALLAEIARRREEAAPGERSKIGRELVEGLALRLSVTLPSWFGPSD